MSFSSLSPSSSSSSSSSPSIFSSSSRFFPSTSPSSSNPSSSSSSFCSSSYSDSPSPPPPAPSPYTPAISSPLNPYTSRPADSIAITAEAAKYFDRRCRRARRPGSGWTLTQSLLRSKAAAAWRRYLFDVYRAQELCRLAENMCCDDDEDDGSGGSSTGNSNINDNTTNNNNESKFEPIPRYKSMNNMVSSPSLSPLHRLPHPFLTQ